MRVLPPTQIDAYTVHFKIVEAKTDPRRARLRATTTLVHARIQQLQAAGPFTLPTDSLGHVCSAPTCEPCPYADLRHLWDVASQPLDQLKAALKAEFQSLGITDCPYCGVNPVDEFDHYLPKQSFPEFSVTSLNLLRCCHQCNTIKRDRRPLGRHRFLHPGLDPLDLQILRCRIVDTNALPRPHFDVDATEIEQLAGIGEEVRFHFEELQLEKRFQEAAAPELSAFLLEIDYNNLPRDAKAGSTALAKARSHFATWGPNRWSTALYFALAEWLGAVP